MSKDNKKTWIKNTYVTKLKESREAMEKRREYLKTWSLPGSSTSSSGESSDVDGGVTTTVTSGDWVTEYKRFLSETEALQNAQQVANHFRGTDWTPEAISALCGNMKHESTINPDMYEYGYDWEADRGYGLVQWTPRSKYWDWAEENGLEPRSGDSQLARIDYEVEQNIQWIAKSTYNNMTFAQFRTNSGNWSVDYLTEAFTWCYERPATAAGQKSMSARKEFAQKCFAQLNFSTSGSSTTNDSDTAVISVYGLQTASQTTTETTTDTTTQTVESVGVEEENQYYAQSVPVGKIKDSKFVAPKYVRNIYVYERKQSEQFCIREGYMPLPSDEFIHMSGPQENLYSEEARKIFRLFRASLGYDQMVVVRGYEPDSSNTSSHSIGIAMDIYVETAEEAIRVADMAYRIGIRSIAIGPKFVHVDAGPPASWGYGNLPIYRGPGTVKVGDFIHGY